MSHDLDVKVMCHRFAKDFELYTFTDQSTGCIIKGVSFEGENSEGEELPNGSRTMIRFWQLGKRFRTAPETTVLFEA